MSQLTIKPDKIGSHVFSSSEKRRRKKLLNAGQIFAHTFLALFLYELLLAENSYQTPWLPKRKKPNQLKNKYISKKRKKDRSTFHLTASLAQAISDDLHFMVRIFPSPSCKTVALFLNQPLSVKINCKGHTSIESQYTLLQYNWYHYVQ